MRFFPKRADDETLGAYPPVTLDGMTLAIPSHMHIGGYEEGSLQRLKQRNKKINSMLNTSA
jgi:hypothetical protein